MGPVSVEMRHPSWHVEEVFALLEQHGAAYCVMSGAGLPCILRATAPFVYVRLHGPSRDWLYGGSYSDEDLAWWAEPHPFTGPRSERSMELMSDRDDFLDWFNTTWRDAEVALHNGDAAPRFDTWSEHEPVTLFGAWLQATGAAEARAVFKRLEQAFGGSTSSSVEVVAADTSGDLAYTAHRELTSTTVDGQLRDYVLRVTQVYRRENGEWKVVHRHADEETPTADPT